MLNKLKGKSYKKNEQTKLQQKMKSCWIRVYLYQEEGMYRNVHSLPEAPVLSTIVGKNSKQNNGGLKLEVAPLS